MAEDDTPEGLAPDDDQISDYHALDKEKKQRRAKNATTNQLKNRIKSGEKAIAAHRAAKDALKNIGGLTKEAAEQLDQKIKLIRETMQIDREALKEKQAAEEKYKKQERKEKEEAEIREQKAKIAQKELRQSEREYVSGETLYVWGKQYFLQVDYSYKGNSLVLDGSKAILTVRKESTAKQREAFVNEWYRGLLKAEVEKYLPKWERITGLHCSSWQSKYMTTRWGTCNTKTHKIWLNLQLAKKPIECLEYVILHELAHLQVKNHGAEFVAILDRNMPNWKDTRKQLNDSLLDYMPAEEQ